MVALGLVVGGLLWAAAAAALSALPSVAHRAWVGLSVAFALLGLDAVGLAIVAGGEP